MISLPPPVSWFATTEEEKKEGEVNPRTGPTAEMIGYIFEAALGGGGPNIPEKVASFPISPLVVARETYVRPEAQSVRGHIRELERNMAQLQQNLASSNEIKNIDFGEGDWLYALWGSCWFWTQPTGDMYTYDVCAFKQAKQGSTLLGNFERLGINTANAEVQGYWLLSVSSHTLSY